MKSDEGKFDNPISNEEQTIYTVHEQYPWCEVVCFYSLEDAQSYIQAHFTQFAYPLITSRRVVRAVIRKDMR